MFNAFGHFGCGLGIVLLTNQLSTYQKIPKLGLWQIVQNMEKLMIGNIECLENKN